MSAQDGVPLNEVEHFRRTCGLEVRGDLEVMDAGFGAAAANAIGLAFETDMIARRAHIVPPQAVRFHGNN